MISFKRWQFAQKTEREYQQHKAHTRKTSFQGLVNIATKKSEYVSQLLRENGFELKDSYSAVEIGSGSHGVIWKFPCKDRTAIDPLANFYFESFSKLQDNSTKIIEAQGEDVPLSDQCAHIVISENVLDHTFRPQKVMNEVARILKPNGVFYCAVDIHKPLWFYLNAVYNGLFNIGLRLNVPVFPAHPYHFREKDILAMLKNSDMDVIMKQISQEKREKKKFRNWLKDFLGKDQLMEVVARPK